MYITSFNKIRDGSRGLSLPFTLACFWFITLLRSFHTRYLVFMLTFEKLILTAKLFDAKKGFALPSHLYGSETV